MKKKNHKIYLLYTPFATHVCIVTNVPRQTDPERNENDIKARKRRKRRRRRKKNLTTKPNRNKSDKLEPKCVIWNVESYLLLYAYMYEKKNNLKKTRYTQSTTVKQISVNGISALRPSTIMTRGHTNKNVIPTKNPSAARHRHMAFALLLHYSYYYSYYYSSGV